MGMSIPEEAGKVATSTIDALRGNPGLLVLLLLQIATLTAVYFIGEANQQRMQARELALFERCFPLQGKDKP
jgi:hypothetical protein